MEKMDGAEMEGVEKYFNNVSGFSFIPDTLTLTKLYFFQIKLIVPTNLLLCSIKYILFDISSLWNHIFLYFAD